MFNSSSVSVYCYRNRRRVRPHTWANSETCSIFDPVNKLSASSYCTSIFQSTGFKNKQPTSLRRQYKDIKVCFIPEVPASRLWPSTSRADTCRGRERSAAKHRTRWFLPRTIPTSCPASPEWRPCPRSGGQRRSRCCCSREAEECQAVFQRIPRTMSRKSGQ